jgi:hypothetical protein
MKFLFLSLHQVMSFIEAMSAHEIVLETMYFLQVGVKFFMHCAQPFSSSLVFYCKLLQTTSILLCSMEFCLFYVSFVYGCCVVL